jgi:mono/diheme cytochrome c family protein
MQNKRILFIILAILLSTVPAGCGSRNTPPPPPPPPGNGNGQVAPVDKPVLDGAALVQDRCAQCHTLERVLRAYDKERWPEIVTSMVKRSPGTLLTDPEYDVVVEYLQQNYSK